MCPVGIPLAIPTNTTLLLYLQVVNHAQCVCKYSNYNDTSGREISVQVSNKVTLCC